MPFSAAYHRHVLADQLAWDIREYRLTTDQSERSLSLSLTEARDAYLVHNLLRGRPCRPSDAAALYDLLSSFYSGPRGERYREAARWMRRTDELRSSPQPGDFVCFAYGRGKFKRHHLGTVAGTKRVGRRLSVRIKVGDGFGLELFTVRQDAIVAPPGDGCPELAA